MEDDRSYRISRRRNPTTRINLRDVVIARDDRKTERDVPLVSPPSTGPLASRTPTPPPMAPPLPPPPAPPPAPTRTATATATPPPVPRRHPQGTGTAIERRTFGGVDFLIEHRGQEVTLIVPGVGRIVGTRDEALSLIAGLLGRT